MDFVKNFTGGNSEQNSNSPTTNSPGSGQQQSGGNGSFLGGIGDKLNGMAGGGRESEKNEDYLDKARLLPLHEQ